MTPFYSVRNLWENVSKSVHKKTPEGESEVAVLRCRPASLFELRRALIFSSKQAWVKMVEVAGVEPLASDLQVVLMRGFCKSGGRPVAQILTQIPVKDCPDLVRLVEAWPSLKPNLKQLIISALSCAE